MKIKNEDITKKFVSTVKNTANEIANTVKEIKIPEIKIVKPENHSSETKAIKTIPINNTLKIIYYLMAVDGEIYQGEERKFIEIGIEFDKDFLDKKAIIENECKNQMDKAYDVEDHFEVIKEGIYKELININSNDSMVTPKLLLWDLLSIAYSDNRYSSKERELIKYIARNLDIDKSTFIEMESSIETFIALENEEKWLKTTNKQYSITEEKIIELENRKNTILKSIKELIFL